MGIPTVHNSINEADLPHTQFGLYTAVKGQMPPKDRGLMYVPFSPRHCFVAVPLPPVADQSGPVCSRTRP